MTTGSPMVVIMIKSDKAKLTTNMFVGVLKDFVCTKKKLAVTTKSYETKVHLKKDVDNASIAKKVDHPEKEETNANNMKHKRMLNQGIE